MVLRLGSSSSRPRNRRRRRPRTTIILAGVNVPVVQGCETGGGFRFVGDGDTAEKTVVWGDTEDTDASVGFGGSEENVLPSNN